VWQVIYRSNGNRFVSSTPQSNFQSKRIVFIGH
jgi:hypothetical protein